MGHPVFISIGKQTTDNIKTELLQVFNTYSFVRYFVKPTQANKVITFVSNLVKRVEALLMEVMIERSNHTTAKLQYRLKRSLKAIFPVWMHCLW